MLPKQTEYIAGIYLRFSKDDERNGESLSIENQRRILTNYVQENGGAFTIPTLMLSLRIEYNITKGQPPKNTQNCDILGS